MPAPVVPPGTLLLIGASTSGLPVTPSAEADFSGTMGVAGNALLLGTTNVYAPCQMCDCPVVLIQLFTHWKWFSVSFSGQLHWIDA